MTRKTAPTNGHGDGPKRAALYARVSTDKQLDNTSPDSQLKRCREYCQKRGYQIADEDIEAIGGSFVLARSKFNKYLTMGADGLLDVIVTDIPDRLGRGDAIAKLELLAQMNNLSVEYAQPGRDASTMEGFIQKSAEQMVSGIERLNIRRRTVQGRRDRARSGQVIACHYYPYGYRFEREFDSMGHRTAVRMVIEESEAKIVRQIFRWYVVEGLTCYAITRRLALEKVPPPRAKHGDWARTTVKRLLANETYIGTWHYGKRNVQLVDGVEKISSKARNVDRSEWIAVKVPAIVEPSFFKAAQVRLRKRERPVYKPLKNMYLLRGHLRCARCNSMMFGSCVNNHYKDRVKTYTYYRCLKNFSAYVNEHCPTPMIPTGPVDAAVWNKIREILKNRKRLFEKIETDRAQTERATRLIQGTIAGIEAENQKTVEKIERWQDLFGEGGMTKEQYYKRERDARAEIKRRELEIVDLKDKLGSYATLTPEQEKRIEEYADTIALGVDNATFEEKIEYLTWLKVSCLYNHETGEVVGNGIFGQPFVCTKEDIARRDDDSANIPFSFVIDLRSQAERPESTGR